MNNFADEIKSRVPMPVLLSRYGFEVRNGRIPCPLHNGRDWNCGVKNGYIHCFVCGESADQISFVQKYFGLSFSDATAKINEDFALGLPIGRKLTNSERIEASRRSFIRRKEIERREAERREVEGDFWNAFDEARRIELQLQDYKPCEVCEQLHPLFVEALKNRDYVNYWLNQSQEELYYYERSHTDT